jgi:hypothetical protein
VLIIVVRGPPVPTPHGTTRQGLSSPIWLAARSGVRDGVKIAEKLLR